MSNDTKALIVLACVCGIFGYALGMAFTKEENDIVKSLVVVMVTVVASYILFYKPDDKEK